MNKIFWVPIIVSFGTIILLYLIGNIFNIDILSISISLSYSEISFIPIVVGILIGFISERIMKLKYQKQSH